MPLFIAVLVGLLALGLLWNRGNDSQLVGAGSTLAAPLVERSVADYRNAVAADNPDRPGQTGGDWVLDGSGGIDYEKVGSMGGVMRLSDPEVDFAVSDYPLSTTALAELQAGQFPVAAGALALVHDLDLGGRALRLDAPTVARIYLGSITRWNDPAIGALNPGLQLPDLAITPLHRSDGSGSTAGLTSWLSENSPEWADGPGSGPQVDFPEDIGRAAERSSGMVEGTGATEGALAYVEPGQARSAGLQVVQLKNRAGNFTAPDAEAMAAALQGMDWEAGDHFTGLSPTETAREAYPLTLPIYVVMKTDPKDQADARRTLGWLRWLVQDYDTSTTGLGYLPLPEAGSRAVASYWATTFQTLD
ncbi:phosphate ABC transporter substrate-binding protein PstS [Luteococcus peritonei]|uniref:Phosphate-binding protein n=1 Tax=Luteococcus peritonei TaxID=88874 RepID=A0ABW4RZ70_9ACTN